MTERPYLRWALWALAGAAGTYLLIHFLLPAALPFLIGLGTALLAEPAVRLCSDKTRLPRWGCAGLCLTALYALTGLLLALGLRRLCAELTLLSRQLPELLVSLAEPVQRLEAWLDALVLRLPDGLGAAAQSAVDGFFETGTLLTGRLPELALSAAGTLVAAVPDAVVFVLTAILSSYFISSGLPKLKQSYRQLLPPKWREHCAAIAIPLKKGMGGWLRAQLKLMGCTFVIVTVGLTLLGVGLPLLMGGLVALIDALPVLGTGTILIPWGLVRFLLGDVRQGAGLLLLYGTAALTRTALEPKLMGRQLGLSPLWTLAAIYCGYRLLGVAGMILLPIAAMLLKQLWDQLGGSFRSSKGQKM